MHRSFLAAYPESPEVDAMMKIIAKKAAAAGDESASSALEGLGFVDGLAHVVGARIFVVGAALQVVKQHLVVAAVAG
ncbi:MAG: hypothetical protein ABFS30_14300, partial [Pseudomonadota bacterium]